MAYDEILAYQSAKRFAQAFPDVRSLDLEIASNPLGHPHYRRNVVRSVALHAPEERLDGCCANPLCRFGQVDLRDICRRARANPPVADRRSRWWAALLARNRAARAAPGTTRHAIAIESLCGGWEHAPGLGGARLGRCANTIGISGTVSFDGPAR